MVSTEFKIKPIKDEVKKILPKRHAWDYRTNAQKYALIIDEIFKLEELTMQYEKNRENKSPRLYRRRCEMINELRKIAIMIDEQMTLEYKSTLYLSI